MCLFYDFDTDVKINSANNNTDITYVKDLIMCGWYKIMIILIRPISTLLLVMFNLKFVPNLMPRTLY